MKHIKTYEKHYYQYLSFQLFACKNEEMALEVYKDFKEHQVNVKLYNIKPIKQNIHGKYGIVYNSKFSPKYILDKYYGDSYDVFNNSLLDEIENPELYLKSKKYNI